MAEEIVVKEPLWPEMQAAGAELTKILDTRGLELTASFWLFLPESGEWRLMLATPMVDQEGPIKAYSEVQKALEDNQERVKSLNLLNISVVSPTLPIVQLIKMAVTTEIHTITNIRFIRSRINNVLIEDALVYRAA